MTKRQYFHYWSLWRQVQRVDPEADRHEIHRQALGYDRSSKLFTNDEFDKVKAAFLRYTLPSSLHHQVRQERMSGSRIRHQVQHDQLGMLTVLLGDGASAAAYMDVVVRERFGRADWPDLKGWLDRDVVMLRNTLAARISKLRQDVGMSEHELRTAAQLPCRCAACAGRRQSGDAERMAQSAERYEAA